MQIDSLAVRLRRRGPWEASDLGVRLYQHHVRSVLGCYLLVALPVMVVALASSSIARWLPIVLIWWLKPWLDRSILFALARGAFGVASSPRDLWRAQRDVWWRQWFESVTRQRFSPWRAFTLPVHQLEGLRGSQRRARAALIRSGYGSTAALITAGFGLIEFLLVLAATWLIAAFAPRGMPFNVSALWFAGDLWLSMLYASVVLFLEPFYVAAGFAMYLNRRVELEAWDIEQEFRRAFAT